MKTIATIVENILSKSHFLLEAIHEDIANASKIARRIRPEVEKEIMEKVSTAAIIAAIRRMPKNAKAIHKDYTKEVSDIIMRSHLVEFQFYNPPSRFALHEKILHAVDKKNPDAYLNIVRGQKNTRIVASAELEKIIGKQVSEQKNFKKFENLAAITIRLPEINFPAAGVYYPFLKKIAWENISYFEITSISNELTIVFEQKDVDRAFSIIKSMSEE